MKEIAPDSIGTDQPPHPASRSASNGRLRFWLYFLIAVIAFATISALGEYRMAQSPTRQRLDAEGFRPLTDEEKFHDHLISPFLGGLVGGVLFVLVQCLPAVWFHDMTLKMNATHAVILAIPFGFVAGAGVSIVLWLIFGGWGPPHPIAACVSGAFITPMLVLTRRPQAPQAA